jgi:hypothetical protein
MTSRFLTTPLLAATLLLSTLGCAKKEDPIATPVVSTSSYKVTGKAIAGQTKGHVQLNVNGTNIDALVFLISNTSPPPNSTGSLLLYFEKPTGQPSTAYKLTGLNYSPTNTDPLAMLDFTTYAGTITETSTDVFSGTFSGTTASGISLSEGVFTNVRLQ